MFYDCKEGEFIVKIIPNLPSNDYWIDEENNVHQRKEYTIHELWNISINNHFIDVYFGKKRFVLYPHKLKLQKKQTWCWENEGISIINNKNIFDVSRRANVILHVVII